MWRRASSRQRDLGSCLVLFVKFCCVYVDGPASKRAKESQKRTSPLVGLKIFLVRMRRIAMNIAIGSKISSHALNITKLTKK